MKELSFKDAFTAGAAWGGAKDAGLNPLQQAQGTLLAEEAVKKERETAKSAQAGPSAHDVIEERLNQRAVNPGRSGPGYKAP